MAGDFLKMEAGDDIRTAQELPDHADVSTSMVDAQVLNMGGRGASQPNDLTSAFSTSDLEQRCGAL